MSFKIGDKVFYFATGGSLSFTALWFCWVWGFLGQMNPDFFLRVLLAFPSVLISTT